MSTQPAYVPVLMWAEWNLPHCLRHRNWTRYLDTKRHNTQIYTRSEATRKRGFKLDNAPLWHNHPCPQLRQLISTHIVWFWTDVDVSCSLVHSSTFCFYLCSGKQKYWKQTPDARPLQEYCPICRSVFYWLSCKEKDVVAHSCIPAGGWRLPQILCFFHFTSK